MAISEQEFMAAAQAAEDQKQHALMLTAQAAPAIGCDKCNNSTFEQVVMMKHLSPLVSPTGKDAIIPFPVFVCNSCGSPFVQPSKRADAAPAPKLTLVD